MRTAARTVDRRVAAAVLTVLVAIVPVACKQVEAVEAEHYQPSKVTPAEDGGHPLVTLTELGAERIGLQTAAIERRRIPYASVLYDAHGGQPYVFVNPGGLDFHREDIGIERIDGDVVVLSDGPGNGTRVVTVGLQQVHGAELEFGAY